jgi:hypothetical protein
MGQAMISKENSEHDILFLKLFSPGERQDKYLILIGQQATVALQFKMISPLG